MTVEQVLRAAAARLAAAGVPSPHPDAEQLLAFACGRPRGSLTAGAALPAEVISTYDALVDKRAQRVPVQHLTGSAGFRYIDLAVGPGVFVPRPETELVAGMAIDLARAAGDRPVVVDLCSGTGAIALAVANELPAADVHAVELDPAALRWLRRNATARAVAGDPAVTVHEGDAATALPQLSGRVDVVVSNPPYVAADELPDCDPEVRDHDPQIALVGADDGLAVIRVVVDAGKRLLRPGGWLVVEHSDRQGQSVPEILVTQGFVDVTDHDDLAGRPRCVTGRLTT